MQRLLLLLGTVALLVAAPAFAQYVFIDVDGDGDCDVNDVLNDTVTSIDIWIDTNHNAGGSTAVCGDGTSPLNIFSYSLILRSRGNVTWGAYTNLIPAFTVHFPLAGSSNATDYYDGFGGVLADTLAAGPHKVGRLGITVAPGTTPLISPVASSPLDAGFFTAFGSECPGSEFDNTLKLGVLAVNGFGDFPVACGPGAPTATRATTWGVIKKLYR
jgi:hypothetical protein